MIDLLLSFSYGPRAIGWTAVAAGAAGLGALVSGLLSAIFGRAFGRAQAALVVPAVILTAGVAMMLFPKHYMIDEKLSVVAFALALTGAFVAALGAVVAATSAAGWFISQLYLASGYALIGFWLLIVTISGAAPLELPHRVVTMGWFAGIVMSLGVAAIPGVMLRTEDEQTAPWLIRYVGRGGNLGWLLLFPIWCLWLGFSKL